MNISVPARDDDDPEFIGIVNRVLLALFQENVPAEAFVIRIDRWFDHKWLKFSGKGRVFFDNAFAKGFADVSLDEFSQDQITFPPFTPQRVLEELHFFRVSGEGYFEAIPDKFVHRSKPVNSATNLHKRVAHFSESGVFIWFNSQTLRSGQGSLMVYQVAETQVQTWFASFEKSGEWKLLQVKGVAREPVAALMKQ